MTFPKLQHHCWVPRPGGRAWVLSPRPSPPCSVRRGQGARSSWDTLCRLHSPVTRRPSRTLVWPWVPILPSLCGGQTWGPKLPAFILTRCPSKQFHEPDLGALGEQRLPDDKGEVREWASRGARSVSSQRTASRQSGPSLQLRGVACGVCEGVWVGVPGYPELSFHTGWARGRSGRAAPVLGARGGLGQVPPLLLHHDPTAGLGAPDPGQSPV